ncbi:MAG: hypothetical protein V3S37_03595, partial [Dehalococcoidia bacterium]
INRNGELVAINVATSFIRSLDLAAGAEGYALVTDSVELTLDALVTGVETLLPRPTPTPSPNAPPLLPSIFRGTVTVQGTAPPAGTRLYTRIINVTAGDQWHSTLIGEDGAYVLAVWTVNPSYKNSTIEFYVEGVKSVQTASYSAAGTLQVLDLTFP